jgi:hypothetical protein
MNGWTDGCVDGLKGVKERQRSRRRSRSRRRKNDETG